MNLKMELVKRNDPGLITLVENFHYSGRMPGVIKYCFIWKTKMQIKATAIFGLSCNRYWPNHALELQRLVRRNRFKKPLSKFLSLCIKWIRGNTTTTYIYSYADTGQGHHGGIYQASGFSFAYESKGGFHFIDQDGNFLHRRTLSSRYGTSKFDVLKKEIPGLVKVKEKSKYLYVKPIRIKQNSLFNKMKWDRLPFPKPNATCPNDTPGTPRESQVEPLEVAPF